MQHDTASLYSFADKSAYDVWSFWMLLLLLGAIHEFGHGLTCKHFGGDVHQMGFLLIYLTPAFYTDTTDILLVRSHVAPPMGDLRRHLGRACSLQLVRRRRGTSLRPARSSTIWPTR